MNDWLTSLLFHVNQPSHSSNKAISNSDLKTTRSRSWMWSKGKTIQSAQYLINLLSFCFTSDNNFWDTAILKFDFEKLKVNVMGEVKGQGHIVHPVTNWCTSFSFHTNQSQPFLRYVQESVWPWKNTSKIFKENLAKKVSNRIPPKSNQVMNMTGGI